MSATLWLAVVLQVVAVALLRLFLGRTWLRRPGTLLVLASAVYDGVSQIVLAFPSVSAWDIYRSGVQHAFTDEADLIMSAGMLAFTIAYLMACGSRRETQPTPTGTPLLARVLDWRVLALACLPLAVLTYEGRGYNSGTLTTGAGASLATSTAAQFFVLLVLLAAFAFLLRHGTQWFLPVLAAQSLLLSAAGERSPVITDAIALVLLLCHSARRPRRAQLHAAAALTLLAVLAVTGVRTEQGRSVFYSGNGLATRAEALSAGLGAGSAREAPGLAAQAAVRLDGTAFAGAILQARRDGRPGISAAGIPESLLIAIPSAVWPSKLTSAPGLYPVQAQMAVFGLQHVNFLPGFAGLYTGFLPWPGLIAFLASAGITWGLGERCLLRRRSPARLVLLAGALTAALQFEGGPPGMLVLLRAAAVIALCAWMTTRVVQAKHVEMSTNPGWPPPAPEVLLPEAP